MIVFRAGSLLPASAPERQAAAQVKDFAAEHGRPVAQQLGEARQQAAEQLRESAQQRAEYVKETAADAASTVSGGAQAAASQVTSQTRESASAVCEQAGPGDRAAPRFPDRDSCDYLRGCRYCQQFVHDFLRIPVNEVAS